jgi:hypothetical protein
VQGSLEERMKNVFEVWLENDRVLPFKVRRFSWYRTAYFLVKRIEPNGAYGKAYGDMYLRGEVKDSKILLNSAGSYQWEMIRTNDDRRI